MIRLELISAGYGKKTVLSDVSASFNKGETVGIIGPNGCGKSTLLKAVAGLIPLSSGKVTVDGVPVDSMKKRDTARKISLLPQGHTADDMTVLDTVLLGRFPHLDFPKIYREADRKAAADAIAQMGLAGYESARLNDLSGGMRQNAYVAMALAQNAEYILLDEPTTYLDVSHRQNLSDTLKRLSASGRGIITVLHDLPLAFEMCDRLVIMNDGKAVAFGTPEEVLTSDVITDVFGVRLGRCTSGGFTAYYYERSV